MLEVLNDTTYTQLVKDDPEDRVQIEVGDSKQPDFKPQVKMMRWDNECNFSVRLQDNETGTETVNTDGNKITWGKGNLKVDFYDIDNAYKFDFRIGRASGTSSPSVILRRHK